MNCIAPTRQKSYLSETSAEAPAPRPGHRRMSSRLEKRTQKRKPEIVNKPLVMNRIAPPRQKSYLPELSAEAPAPRPGPRRMASRLEKRTQKRKVEIVNKPLVMNRIASLSQKSYLPESRAEAPASRPGHRRMFTRLKKANPETRTRRNQAPEAPAPRTGHRRMSSRLKEANPETKTRRNQAPTHPLCDPGTAACPVDWKSEPRNEKSK